ncbi:hypothetical protein MD484_g3232, partial [Candolleomyces efflorescens]
MRVYQLLTVLAFVAGAAAVMAMIPPYEELEARDQLSSSS